MTVRQQMKELCSCLCRQDELYATLARRHGMSFHTALTLYALDQDEGCTQKQIAENWADPQADGEHRGEGSGAAGVCVAARRPGSEGKTGGSHPGGTAFAAPCLREIYELEDRAVDAMGQERFREMVEANTAFTRAFAREVHGV